MDNRATHKNAAAAKAMTALGEDREDRFDLSAAEALTAYDLRDADRCRSWRNQFS